jgi:DNA polymerase I
MGFNLTDTASEDASGLDRSTGSGSAKMETLKVMNLEYTEVEAGNVVPEPVVELFCRDEDGNRRQVNVSDYYPHFLVTEEEFVSNKEALLSDTRVRKVKVDERLLSEDDALNASIEGCDGAPAETLEGRDLVRIFTVVPGDVADLRDDFEETWEADVFFTNRFLIDSGILSGVRVPEFSGEVQEVSYEEIEAVADESAVPDVRPRMLTVDIEVWSGGSFPDTQEASKPVTAISAHDSYSGEYYCGVLHPKVVEEGDNHSWDSTDLSWELPDGVSGEQCQVEVYYQEEALLADFNKFVVSVDPDLMTGWNSSRNEIGSGFDYPYIINRCELINEWSYQDLSYERGHCFVDSRGAPHIDGREMFDMLQAYKKTQIHEKRSYGLGYIAEEELGYGKEDVEDLDEGWLHNPVEFMKYNIRDVEAVHKIEESKSVLKIYDHIRSITGATYSEIADSNIGIIDMLFLRRAKERGYALPTSERPDVQHYWGGYVFPPQSGKHKNVVYPDLSSLYPNLFRDMNASPETIIGDESDLYESEYSKSDCHTIYIDARSESKKKEADEPVRDELYVLKPDVKESFVREIVQELIDMKYEYKKDEYSGEAYGAVKRITNSVYGVMGDSVSYGKGFRLFDWKIAEAITLAGRDVIKHTAKTFESRIQSMGYGDAEIIAGDTDSCVCTIPGADGTYTRSSLSQSEAADRIRDAENLDVSEEPVDSELHESLIASIEAAEYVDMTYDRFMEKRYNIEDGNMSVEIESFSESALFMDAKKRYAQLVKWDEGEYVDEAEYKGFELVRSDSARITGEVQTGVIDRILENDSPEEIVSEYLQSEWESVVDGDVDLERLGRPSAINNPLFDYGWTIDEDKSVVKYFTPQPHIRGARYAKAYIEGEDPSEGSKPLMFYTKGVAPNSGLPETYDYGEEYSLDSPEEMEDANLCEMKELDREVDCVSVEDVRRMPDAVMVDYEKMGEKTVRDPVEPIIEVMGWSFDDLITDGQQTGLASFM